MSSGASVRLHVYDLSGGMAMAMSQSFIGKRIDGIWHTGIVVYGNEYYYGGGLQVAPAGVTPYGNPVKVEELGRTSKSKAEFEAFLAQLAPSFTPASYHLLDNNCNHFTDAASRWLTGNPIPAYVRELPSEFLSTPLGQMMRPVIDSMMGGMGGALGESVNSVSSAVPVASATADSASSSESSIAPTPRYRLASDTSFVTFASFNAGGVTKHIRSQLEKDQHAALAEMVAATCGSVDALCEWIADLKADPEAAGSAQLAGSAFDALLNLALMGLEGKDAFAVLDVLRIAVLRPRLAQHLLADKDDARLASLWALAQPDSAVRHVRIMVFRLVANVLSMPRAGAYLRATNERATALVSLLLAHTTDEVEAAVRTPAIAAVHNLAMIADTAELSDTYLQLVAGLTERLLHIDLALVTDLLDLYRLAKALAHLVVEAPHGTTLVQQLGLPASPWLAAAQNPPGAPPPPGSPAALISELARELAAILA
ncbi:thioredoxin [Thecamonas trahens ATCC 50062]|uniref:Thioredoxin n=1 Tax=Thecamonas trahens ATCC 50062 TaxID=461836 RepID=A0A0L0DQ47_THETB|nr:thioredoxin [Thecamonas trahens ATCC 50062]KNC54136.1 thioredoxin [Thecamonas trahens ATCC 50062]|eukprot:XP_013753957.1 thioredoxin [Thecamonas trahens ATCC 50062]